MSKLDDLMGKVFGRLTVIARAANGPRFKTRWVCRCSCGSELRVYATNLKRGLTVSCGCQKYEPRKKPGHLRHGLTASPTYMSWCAMHQRCRNPKNATYRHYGGRGITVCERWATFTNFLADMGVRPHGTSLDRYPNRDGNYEPGNCRWATAKEQRSNRRDSH